MTSLNEGQHVLHWRQGSWHPIDWDTWPHFTGWAKPWAPLPGVGTGEHYFVVCILSDGRLYNIIPHRYLVDSDGRIIGDVYFGVLTDDEIPHYKRLNERHYESPQTLPLSDDEQKDFDAIRDRLWRSWLPPAEAMRELMRVVGAMPDEGDAAWRVLLASGLQMSSGFASRPG